MIVNLNVMTKVQLNELGKQIWLSEIDKLPPEVKENNPQIVSNMKQRLDEHNCLEIELWALMSIFGPYMSPVNMPFSTTTIELKRNPDFGTHFS